MTHLRTRAVHAGQHPDPASGAIATPITQSTAFAYGSLERGAAIFAGEAEGYHYGRYGNPTVVALEAKMADLEGAEAAVAAVARAPLPPRCWHFCSRATNWCSLGRSMAARKACCAPLANAGACA